MIYYLSNWWLVILFDSLQVQVQVQVQAHAQAQAQAKAHVQVQVQFLEGVLFSVLYEKYLYIRWCSICPIGD